MLAWKILLKERIMEVKLTGTDCGVGENVRTIKGGTRKIGLLEKSITHSSLHHHQKRVSVTFFLSIL